MELACSQSLRSKYIKYVPKVAPACGSNLEGRWRWPTNRYPKPPTSLSGRTARPQTVDGGYCLFHLSASAQQLLRFLLWPPRLFLPGTLQIILYFFQFPNCYYPVLEYEGTQQIARSRLQRLQNMDFFLEASSSRSILSVFLSGSHLNRGGSSRVSLVVPA